MKLRTLFLLSLFVSLSLLVLGTPLPASAQIQSPPEEPAAPTAFCDSVTEIPKIECEALVALYDDTNGSGWIN
jgi:hypothetical protein